MVTPYRLLFVCLGNICRSPAAENTMRHLVQKRGLQNQVLCDSAGTIGYHVGNPPDARMSSAAQRRGISFEGRARQFSKNDFKNFDFIFTMDDTNYQDVLALAQDEAEKQKIHPFCQYVQNFDDAIVPDPYYGGPQGFEHVLDLMKDGCAHILDNLIHDEPSSRS